MPGLSLGLGMGLSRRISSGSTGYNPLTAFPGLREWFDPTRNVAHTGNSTSLWTGQKNGYNLTQPLGARQPLTNTQTVNGRNVIKFDGSDDFMNMPVELHSLLAGNSFVMMVAGTNLATGSHTLIESDSTTGGGNNYYNFGPNTSNTLRGIHNNYSVSTASLTISRDINAHIWAIKRTGSALSISLDGGAWNNAAAVNITPNTYFTVGRNGPAGSSPLNGFIGDFLIGDSDLTPQEYNTNITGLRSLWGTP